MRIPRPFRARRFFQSTHSGEFRSDDAASHIQLRKLAIYRMNDGAVRHIFRRSKIPDRASRRRGVCQVAPITVEGKIADDEIVHISIVNTAEELRLDRRTQAESPNHLNGRALDTTAQDVPPILYCPLVSAVVEMFRVQNG